MMWLLLLLAGLAANAEFEVQTLSGQTANGQLVELNAEHLVLSTASGRETFAIESLATVARKGASPTDDRKADSWVELADQSLLAANNLRVRAGMVQFQLTTGAALEVPTRAIRAIHFTQPGERDAKLARQWSDISATKAGGDLLVVRKNASLDYLEGVQGDIDAETCKFDVDKEVIPVKRLKVEGIIYFHPAVAELPEAIGQVSALDGSRITMRSAALGGETIKLTTPSGITLSLPSEQILRFDYSAGKIAYLSDLDPESARYSPFLGFKDDLPALQEFYQFRRDIGFEQRPLQLDGKTYKKGLALQSRTVLSYKLPGRFRLFRTILGIDDSVRETGNARLEIKGDGKTLWQGEVRGNQPPHELELEIASVRRLEIIADYGEDLDIGDRLDLADARVTK